MNAYSIIMCFVAIVATVAATDYCSIVCWNKFKNVACGNSGKFAASCPADAKMVPIDDSLKQIIVDAHNVKRNFIAGGGEAKLSPACRMATMEWDEELAYVASFNPKKCAFGHDKCIKTAVFAPSGQNLAMLYVGKTYDNTEKITEAIQLWYNEVKNTNQSHIDSYPTYYINPKKAIVHFTVMMAERNIRVGCAVATYTGKGTKYIVACNYATNNIRSEAIYKSCNKAATACTTGKNPQYPNLCSSSEDYGYGIIPKFKLK